MTISEIKCDRKERLYMILKYCCLTGTATVVEKCVLEISNGV